MMHSVSSVEPIILPDLPGVEIFPVGGITVEVGKTQILVVVVEPGGTIPPHTHSGDAHMLITRGKAKIISECELNGTEVGPGDEVFFEAGGVHGFKVVDEDKPFVFVSRNPGFIGPDHWDFFPIT